MPAQSSEGTIVTQFLGHAGEVQVGMLMLFAVIGTGVFKPTMGCFLDALTPLYLPQHALSTGCAELKI